MPVSTIDYQPSIAQLLAAYRPIRFIVTASGASGLAVPPFVVCDIYIEGKYYKSTLSTAADAITAQDSQFSFDIGDVLQEYLAVDLSAIDNRDVLQAPHSSAKVVCKFRASDIDADGFTVEEGPVPVQATKFTDPVSGGGTVSNEFFVINAALQHEDHQNLASHLSAFRQGAWNADAFPQSHRKNYFFCPGDSDHYPVIYRGDCLQADLILKYRLKGSQVFQTAISQDFNVCEPLAFSISNIIRNRVTVTIDDAIPVGHYVLAQYKPVNDAVWIDIGTQTTQQFSFSIGRVNYAGDYDIRLIHFCSDCFSAEPAVDSFTLEGLEVETAWRGYAPFCVQQVFDQPIYIALELRNHEQDETFFPSSDVKFSRTVNDTYDLYVKFFSDANHLNPLVMDMEGLQLYLRVTETRTEHNGAEVISRVVENVVQYNVNAHDTEAFVQRVTTQTLNEQFGPYPTVTSSSTSAFTFEAYPTHALTSGNTGLEGYAKLRLYNTDFDIPVLPNPFNEVIKVNDPSDPDYIAPGPSANCPAGPDRLYVTYGALLQIAKVEIKYGGQFAYPEGVNNSQAGGYKRVLPIPKNTATNIAIKAKTLDNTNNSAKINVAVTFIDGAGALTTNNYQVPNNIETNIPATFKNATQIAITN